MAKVKSEPDFSKMDLKKLREQRVKFMWLAPSKGAKMTGSRKL